MENEYQTLGYEDLNTKYPEFKKLLEGKELSGRYDYIKDSNNTITSVGTTITNINPS